MGEEPMDWTVGKAERVQRSPTDPSTRWWRGVELAGSRQSRRFFSILDRRSIRVFLIVTHFQTISSPPYPPGKVDRVQLGLPIGNKSYSSMLSELTKGPFANLNPQHKISIRKQHRTIILKQKFKDSRIYVYVWPRAWTNPLFFRTKRNQNFRLEFGFGFFFNEI